MYEISYLKKTFYTLILLQSVSNFGYYMMNFYVGQIPGGIIKNTLSSQFAELSSVILSGFLLQNCGFKKAFLFNYSMSLMGMVLMFIFWEDTESLIYCIFMGKFGFSAAFNLVFIGFVKLLPNMYNTTAFGKSIMCACAVTTFSPVVATLAYPAPILCSLLSLVIGITASFQINEKVPKFI